MINLSFLQDFPKDFKFGVATSSYQIEGRMYGNCGKSIWDDFAERKLNGIDGKFACNHIEYFKEDIKLIKDAGFKTYRFSFAWPRLFPDNSIRGVKNMLAYATSKSAIISFTASLALDLTKNKIRVNAVAPGAIETPMLASFKKDLSLKDYQKKMKENHPIGRVGKPKEVANVIYFLASESASFMTGLTIPVDGGRSIR